MSTKKINTIYNACLAEPWLDVINKLDEELDISPAYFIGWKNDHGDNISQSHPSCFYQTIEDAWRGINFPELDYRLEIDENMMKEYAHEKLLAIKMMDRLDLSRTHFTYSNRELFFNRLLKYWLTIVEVYDINLIISTSVPHRVFDYVLYIVAKMKNIETVMFQMSPFPDSSFILSDINEIPSYIKTHLKQDSVNNSLREDILKRLEKVGEDYQKAIPFYMIKQQKNMQNTTFTKNMFNRMTNLLKSPLSQFEEDDSYYTIRENDLPYAKKNLSLHRKLARHKNSFYQKKLQKEYESLAITPDYDKKYVFVALHYQPEETSTPTGGIYSNQILILELLHSFLDDKYQIYVKEHKTQLNPNHDGALGRNRSYYQDILSISNRIHLIKMDTTPFDLIDRAVATVTISGTTGWESAIRGTPSLIFGRAWYEDMPGVFKIKSYSDLEKNWESILKTKKSLTLDEIKAFHKKMQYFFIDAPHYRFFKDKVQRTAEENCNNIFNGINNHLKRINFFKKS